MPFESEQQRKFMYAKHPKIAKRWSNHTPKNKKLPKCVRERFDIEFDKYMSLYLIENYPSNAQSNSGGEDYSQNNSGTDLAAGMPSVNPQGNNPQAFKKVKPNNSPKQAPPKLDPNFLNALKKSHDPNNPNQQQTEQNIRNLMSQPNAPMIDQNGNDYQSLPPEVQTALQKHSNELAQQNNYQKNVQSNGVKQPPLYQSKKTTPSTGNYMPQQSQRPSQSQGSVGGAV